MQDRWGRRLTFQVARRGSVLGMETVLFGCVCEWSADTLHSSRIGTIGWEEFVRFAERHPEVYRIASRQLIQTVEAACSTLRIIGLNSCIRKRLALQLLDWGQRGSTNGDQTQFRLAFTHEQIAEFVGAARESITRALIIFRQLGLIEIRGSMVRIPSTTALRNYAERV
jgi:CRP/FNR family transcriptional regulator, cyclic AMP receptor protein